MSTNNQNNLLLRLASGSAIIASTLIFATSSQAGTLSVKPGFNQAVFSISNPDSSGTRYLGGLFTGYDSWDTGNAAVVDTDKGRVNIDFKVKLS